MKAPPPGSASSSSSTALPFKAKPSSSVEQRGLLSRQPIAKRPRYGAEARDAELRAAVPPKASVPKSPPMQLPCYASGAVKLVTAALLPTVTEATSHALTRFGQIQSTVPTMLKYMYTDDSTLSWWLVLFMCTAMIAIGVFTVLQWLHCACLRCWKCRPYLHFFECHISTNKYVARSYQRFMKDMCAAIQADKSSRFLYHYDAEGMYHTIDDWNGFMGYQCNNRQANRRMNAPSEWYHNPGFVPIRGITIRKAPCTWKSYPKDKNDPWYKPPPPSVSPVYAEDPITATPTAAKSTSTTTSRDGTASSAYTGEWVSKRHGAISTSTPEAEMSVPKGLPLTSSLRYRGRHNTSVADNDEFENLPYSTDDTDEEFNDFYRRGYGIPAPRDIERAQAELARIRQQPGRTVRFDVDNFLTGPAQSPPPKSCPPETQEIDGGSHLLEYANRVSAQVSNANIPPPIAPPHQVTEVPGANGFYYVQWGQGIRVLGAKPGDAQRLNAPTVLYIVWCSNYGPCYGAKLHHKRDCSDMADPIPFYVHPSSHCLHKWCSKCCAVSSEGSCPKLRTTPHGLAVADRAIYEQYKATIIKREQQPG